MINLFTLNLEALRAKGGNDHYILKRRLSEDEIVYKTISKRFNEFVKEPTSEDSFEVGSTYVIRQGDNAIGMIGSTTMTASGVMDLWLCLDKQYRNMGYGEKALAQTTQYLIGNMDKLNNIRLMIDKSNYGSNEIAVKSGYVLVDMVDQKNVYQYFEEPKKKVASKH